MITLLECRLVMALVMTMEVAVMLNIMSRRLMLLMHPHRHGAV